MRGLFIISCVVVMIVMDAVQSTPLTNPLLHNALGEFNVVCSYSIKLYDIYSCVLI